MASADVGSDDLVEVAWDRDGDGDPIRFTVAPLGLYGYNLMLELAAAVGPQGGSSRLSRESADGLVQMVAEQVVGWRNVVRDGAPAEPTLENRLAFFSRPANLPALRLVQDELLRPLATRDDARPNGSGGGSASNSPTPGSPAERGTSTDPSAGATPAEGGGDAGG